MGRKKRAKRVTVVNGNRQNGPIGEVAHPLEADLEKWTEKGWNVAPDAQGEEE